MQEAYIHLPEADNDGLSLDQEATKVADMILEGFGGFTAQEAKGAWKDPDDGKLYIESVTRIAIAADWDDLRNVNRLLGIAQEAAALMRQVCVYVAFPGDVRFVEPAKALAA